MIRIFEIVFAIGSIGHKEGFLCICSAHGRDSSSISCQESGSTAWTSEPDDKILFFFHVFILTS